MGIKNIEKKSLIKLAGLILLCELVGIIGSLFTVKSSMVWYKELIKPFFTPPNWIFAPIWILLYLLMGISLYIITEAKNSDIKKQAIIAFSIQLFLNALWTPAFFGFKALIGSTIIIFLLLISIFITFYKFYKISPESSYLLIPYILWVSFAAGLNLSIMLMNI